MSNEKPYTPDDRAKNTFELLRLNANDIRKFYRIFSYVDRDGSGEISIKVQRKDERTEEKTEEKTDDR